MPEGCDSADQQPKHAAGDAMPALIGGALESSYQAPTRAQLDPPPRRNSGAPFKRARILCISTFAYAPATARLHMVILGSASP